MNLSRILDKKEDYLGLIEISPNNLYFNIAQKAAKFITPQNNRNKISLSWNILGNKVDFYYGNDQVNLVLGGKRYTGYGANLKALEEALYNLFQGELKGEVSLTRPESTQRTFLSDRNDFNKAKGTCFSKLYKEVVYDKEGKKNVEVMGSRNNAYALTPRQFENASAVKTFKPSNFTKVNRDGTVFYINKGVEFIDFDYATFRKDSIDEEPRNVTLDDFYQILTRQDRNLDWWARTDVFGELYENLQSYKVTAVLYKGKVWLVIPKTGGEYQVKPFI